MLTAPQRWLCPVDDPGATLSMKSSLRDCHVCLFVPGVICVLLGFCQHKLMCFCGCQAL